MADPGQDEVRVLLESGAAAYGNGDIAGALRAFQEAARVATGDWKISAMINAASMFDELGDHTGSIATLRAALEGMSDGPSKVRPAALINLSQALQHVGELDEAQDALEEARTSLQDRDDLGQMQVACLLSLTAVAIHRQDWSRAAEIATESLDAAIHFAPELAGHPLMNLAAIHFETGRTALAEDFGSQALAAFETAGDQNAVAETQQNLGMMAARSEHFDLAEPLLLQSQSYFEQSGNGYRAGVGRKTLAFLAEGRGDLDRAAELYDLSLEYFEVSGATLDAADVRTRLATLAFDRGAVADGERLFSDAFAAYSERGLGLHCAQIDFWHASLLEKQLATHQTDLGLATTAAQLAVPAALAIDAVRYTLPNGYQREQWNRRIADPAMSLAFRLGYRCGDARLVADLVETQCAGTTVKAESGLASGSGSGGRSLDFLELPPSSSRVVAGSLQLGSALAGVAAGVGLSVEQPARLALDRKGRIALSEYIDAAEQRYGRAVRDEKVLRAW
jgi:tetratricopeptide (TPR) repeat protein